jgi:hypothetical protein
VAQPGSGQVAQIASNHVLGDAQLGGEILRDQPTIALEAVKKEILPVRRKHTCYSSFLRVITRLCL